MRKLPLSNGGFAIVDDVDFAMLSAFKWRRRGDNYVVRCIGVGRQKRELLLHRAILGLTNPAIKTDHRNGDPLDNRRDNLRSCSQGQNVCNKSKKRGGLYPYKGIRRNRQAKAKPWQAAIGVNYRTIVSRYFATAIEAAREYDRLALQYQGEFAKTNRALGLLDRPDLS